MEKPIVLEGKRGNGGWKCIEGFPPIECAACGHVMKLRKYPDGRRSKLRCGGCGIPLIWIPTEEQAMESVRRAQADAKEAGPMYGNEK